MKSLPKVLIVSRGVWDESKGTSSTLSNLFSDYPANKLAMIYTETKLPYTDKCSRFFQISEYALVKKLFHWKTETGREVSPSTPLDEGFSSVAQKEEKTLGFIRRHRSIVFTFLRDVLWGLGLWKSKSLSLFIRQYNPDVLWFDGSTNIFLNNLYHHVYRIAKKPAAIFLMDDNYTYKSVIRGHYIYRFFMRRSARRIIKECSKVYVISPKMKEEFDKTFNINSIILTKGIDYRCLQHEELPINNPLRLVYLGQIIYGRIDSLLSIVKALDSINKDKIKVKLFIYTNNYIKPNHLAILSKSQSVEIKPVVPYEQVPSVIKENDVLLFVESLNRKYNKDVRLSFSTKITDYLKSGKCIFAVGPKDSAPMSYFENEGCAIVAYNEDDIQRGIELLMKPNVTRVFSQKAFETGKKNHNKDLMNERLFSGLKEIMSNKI